MRLAARPRATLVALLLAALAPASLAISYTVQVVALSDQQAALGVQRALLDEDYPAYVVRATTAQGDIYRVRVGAFANRAAALLYAEAMPVIVGSPPLPALAEGIPSGVMPLEPRVLAQLAGDEAEVLPWPGGIALRSQPDETLPATYRVVRGGATWTFEAWRAEPVEGAVIRLRNMSLWPATWQQEAPEVREEYRLQRLDALATRLALPPASLELLQQRPTFGPPFLVVLELVDSTSGGATVVGVAEADGPLSGHGPEALALGDGELPDVGAPLYRAEGQQAAESGAQGGEAWRVVAAGDFFLLSTENGGGAAWKAGVGTPLWSDGNHLLVRSGSGLILYDFVGR
jgi:hypothetical protein